MIAPMNRIICLAMLAFLAAGPAFAAPNAFVPVPTLGVLYFENATGLDHLAWLPKGFLELLNRDIEATGRVKIIPRKMVEQVSTTYAGTKTTAFTNKVLAIRLGKIMKTTHLLAGRFTRRDTDLVIELKLYDVKLGKQTGWRQVEGPSDDLLYLQKQVALKTFELLKLQLTDRQFIDLLQIPTASLKAFGYYSMGLDALDRDDRDQARSHFQAAMQADKFFKPAAEAISGMAFVLSGKAILRTPVEDTAVVGVSAIKSVEDLLELARANAFDFQIGDPVPSAVEDDTLLANVKLPIAISVRPDYVNLWLYSIRRLGRQIENPAQTRPLTLARSDLFDQPVVLSLPDPLAREWLEGWKNLRMRLVFQDNTGRVLFETPKTAILPLYLGNAEGQFAEHSSVVWKLETSFDVERIPKQFFDEPLQVSLEIDR